MFAVIYFNLIYFRFIKIHLSTLFYDRFKMAHAASDAIVIRCSKCQKEYSGTERVDRLAHSRLMTSSRSLGCCRSKT